MLKSNEQLTNLAKELAGSGAPRDLVNWLIKLKLMIGVPFNYLVPDSDFLPPESIRFFHLDPNWIAAMTDGALSIGRHYGGADAVPVTLRSDQVHAQMMHRVPEVGLRLQRQRQLGLVDATEDTARIATTPNALRSGFLLNSAVVKGWKSIDVAGYAKGKSPFDFEQNPAMPTTDITPLDTLRLVRLSASVMLGIFEGDLYELVLHQPPEAIHFGFSNITCPDSDNAVTKTLRVPTIDWDDPDTTYDASSYQDQELKDVFANRDERVLDMTKLSETMAAKLASIKPDPGSDLTGAPGYYQANPTDKNFKNHLVASDFALEMVQGVGLVSFINE